LALAAREFVGKVRRPIRKTDLVQQSMRPLAPLARPHAAVLQWQRDVLPSFQKR
jgi:hypothetical protein